MRDLILIPSGARWLVMDDSDHEIGAYASEGDAWAAIQDHVHRTDEESFVMARSAHGEWREAFVAPIKH